MPFIHITTFVEAPIERVFDLSRSMNLYRKSMQFINGHAVAGTMSGLINEGDTITWKAKYLYKIRVFKMGITDMKPYSFFSEKMIKGDLASLKHEHHFKSIENGTIMIDQLNFEIRYGFAGRLINKLFLTNYIKHLLEHRNEIIKTYAESQKWKTVLQ